MIVELRNGDKYMVIKDYTNKRLINIVTKDVLLEINGNGYMSLDTYTDDLLRPSRDEVSVNFDIIKVYYIECLGVPTKGLKLLWERESKNNVKDVFDRLSHIYKNAPLIPQIEGNGYAFSVYFLGNKRARAFMDKQKLEKSRFEEVINILVKQLDESILLAFKL